MQVLKELLALIAGLVIAGLAIVAIPLISLLGTVLFVIGTGVVILAGICYAVYAILFDRPPK